MFANLYFSASAIFLSIISCIIGMLAFLALCHGCFFHLYISFLSIIVVDQGHEQWLFSLEYNVVLRLSCFRNVSQLSISYQPSLNIPVQPRLPCVRIPRALDLPFDIPIKHDGGADMHASQPRCFDQYFDVIRDAIADIVRAGDGLRRDLEHLVDAGLVDTDGSSENSETCVGGVAGFVDDLDVEVFYLVIKQCLGDFILGSIYGNTVGLHTAEKAQNLEASTRSTASAASWAADDCYMSSPSDNV